MRFQQQLYRDRTTRFSRMCAALCLLLLLFSVAHTALGHADALTAPLAPATHSLQPLSLDGPDTCALCVAMTTVVVLVAMAFSAPQLAKPRPPIVQSVPRPVTGWHPSLFSRPPPVR